MAYSMTGIFAEAPILGEYSKYSRRQPIQRIDHAMNLVNLTSEEPLLSKGGINLRTRDAYN